MTLRTSNSNGLAAGGGGRGGMGSVAQAGG